MKKIFIGAAILAVISGFLFIPVLITQFSKSGSRSFQGVKMEETNYQEVRFRNAVQDISLAGMLFIPEGDGPFPAAVIIHGSGTSSRSNGWYLTLTQYLQENGIVVLLPDKRGSEQSEGDWRTASFQDLATDTLAAINFLMSQDEAPISYIGVVGMSQGGHIAPIVASQSADVSFLVNVVGAAVPMYEQLRYEENHNLRELGILPGISKLLAYPSSWMIRNVAQPDFWAAVGNFNPLPYWRELSIDALVLYGAEDTNVPSSKSAAILQALDKSNLRVKIYEGSGHALEDPEGTGDSIFREEAMIDIAKFIISVSPQPQIISKLSRHYTDLSAVNIAL